MSEQQPITGLVPPDNRPIFLVDTGSVQHVEGDGPRHSVMFWDLLACPVCHPLVVKAVQDVVIELSTREPAALHHETIE